MATLGLLRQQAVQDELGLSPDQREQISQLGDSLREEMSGTFRGLRDLSEEERAAKMSEMTASVQSKVDAALTAEQTARLRQLELQREGPSAFGRDEIAGQIGLSQEQRDSIRAVLDESRERGRGDPSASREERQAAREAADRDRDRKLLAILTDEQRQQWTASLGKVFTEFEQSPFAGGFQRGGGRLSERAAEPVSSEPQAAPVTTAAAADSSSTPEPSQGQPADEQSASPTATSTETAAGTAPAAATGEKRLRFNFRFAPWDEVLQWFADEAGLSLMMDQPPTGTFNYYDDRSYTPTEALDLLNGVLLTKSFTLLRRGKLLVVVRADQAIPPNLVPRIPLEEIDERGENELVSVVLQLEHVEAKGLSEELQPLLGPQGKIVPLTAANQIVVTDTVANLRKLRELLDRFDSSEDTAHATLRIFPIRYADPAEVEQVVRNMLGAASRTTSGDDRRRRGGPEAASDVSVAVDLRTRTLLVRAEPGQLALVEQVLRTVDVGPGLMGGSGLPPQLEVYSLKRSDANAVLAVLQTVLAGQTDVRLAADTQQRSVIVLAPPDRQQMVRTLVEQMDGAGTRIEVIPLRRLDAQTAAAAVQSLFGTAGEGATTGASAQPGPDGRSLMVRGNDAEIAQIKSLLVTLGETPATSAGSNNPVRVIPLGEGTSRQLIETLREIWPAIRKNPIRVVEPAGEPSTRRDAPPKRSAPDAEFEADLTAFLDELDAPLIADFDEDLGDDVPPTAEPAVAENVSTDRSAEAPIIISTGAGSLVIASEDTDALNSLEDLIHTLNRQRGASANYHVFFLKAADAEQVVTTLNQMLTSTTVLASTSTMPRRIVADVRTNALLVEASPADLERIEMLLETLDSADLPETDIARQPRIVSLRYARATTVAEVLRDVYRDQLGAPGQSNQGSDRNDAMQSFIAPFRGRNNGGSSSSESTNGRSRQAGAARMSLGVDDAANLLVVAAPQALFLEVETVVRALDEAARDTRRSVHVIPIVGGNSTAVQSALGALVGSSIKPAGGGQQQGRNTSAGRSNGGPASTTGSAGDGGSSEIRQQLMQRMFERGGFRGSDNRSDEAPQRGDSDGGGQRRGGRRGN
jgi:type II secretory pathway component GspD/PulD (secretin)